MSYHWKLQLRALPSSLSGFMTSAMPTISELTMVRVLQPVSGSPNSGRFSQLIIKVPEMEPLKRQRSLFYVLKRKEMAQPVLFYNQSRQLPCARHPYWSPPIPHLHNGLHSLITVLNKRGRVSDARYRCQNIDISDTGVTATGIDT